MRANMRLGNQHGQIQGCPVRVLGECFRGSECGYELGAGASRSRREDVSFLRDHESNWRSEPRTQWDLNSQLLSVPSQRSGKGRRVDHQSPASVATDRRRRRRHGRGGAVDRSADRRVSGILDNPAGAHRHDHTYTAVACSGRPDAGGHRHHRHAAHEARQDQAPAGPRKASAAHRSAAAAERRPHTPRLNAPGLGALSQAQVQKTQSRPIIVITRCTGLVISRSMRNSQPSR